MFRKPLIRLCLSLLLPVGAAIAQTATPTDYPTLKAQKATGIAMADGAATTRAARNALYSCRWQTGTAGFGFSWVGAGNLISFADKPMVEGTNVWTSQINRVLSGTSVQYGSNGLPDHYTGTYPVAANTEAGRPQYHPDPSAIAPSRAYLDIPQNPTLAASPRCVGNAVGLLFTGGVLFDPLDADGRDAVANEIQDRCEGHPEATGTYHYHHLTNCFTDSASGHSVQIGYAFDGFGIYGPKGENGQVLTNAELDECHGHTHGVTDINGVTKTEYHYHGNLEFPYVVGCFRGTTRTDPLSVYALTTPETGFWYTSGANGRGYGVEVQGSRLFFAIYTYTARGEDVWYTGLCMLGKTSCSGTLAAFRGGTGLADLGTATTAPTAGTSPGSFTLTVTSTTAMTVTITPTGSAATSYALTRFPIAGAAVADAPSWAPQAGWWYAPDYGGTGWMIEAQGGSGSTSNFFVVGYAYGATGGSGQPNWYAGSGKLTASGSAGQWAGELYEYQAGASLTGSGGSVMTYADRGAASIVFTGDATATMALPNGRRIALQRFAFN